MLHNITRSKSKLQPVVFRQPGCYVKTIIMTDKTIIKESNCCLFIIPLPVATLLSDSVGYGVNSVIGTVVFESVIVKNFSVVVICVPHWLSGYESVDGASKEQSKNI